MIPKQSTRLSYILLILFSVAAVLILFFRIPFGVDVTDTSFWTADPYLVVQGSVPIIDSSSLSSLTFLLIAPFVKLFTAVTGGTEGIMLFMFYVSFLFRLTIPILIWLLLRKRTDPFWAAVFCLLFFICDYGTNRYLNYNFISQALLALSGSLLWDALGQEKPRDAAIRYALAGFVMALCALAHITQVANCFLFSVFLLFLERRRWGKLPCWLPYVLTGLTVAVLTIVGLEAAGGGGLFPRLFSLLGQSNSLRIARLTISEQFGRIFGGCVQIIRFGFLPFVGIFALYFILFYRKSKQTVLPGLMAALAGSCGFVCLSYAHSFLITLQTGQSPFLGAQPVFLCLFLTTPVWFLLLSRQDRQRFLPGFLFFWASGIVTVVLSAMASYTPADYRYTFLISGALLSLPLAPAAFKAHSPELRFSSGIHKALLLFLAGSLALYTISVQYACVYRDDAISALTCRVEKGVYKGLFTTSERAEALQKLEEQLQSRVSPGEAVLFADLMPTAYLMTDGHPCTPTSWDPCKYRNGFQDDDAYQNYFERTGIIPDKIFFIQSEENPLSIDDPENEFAAWVYSNYTLAETVGEGLFSFRLFIKDINQ